MDNKIKTLKERLSNNSRHKFQNHQTNAFLALLKKRYENVLEVGCGKGYFSYVGALNGKFANCSGSDVFQDYQLDEIGPLCESVSYARMEADRLPYADNSFDLVFSMDVIEHVDDDKEFLAESLRVCKPGGLVIIGTPNYYRITNLFLKMIGKLHYPRKMGVDSYGDVIHLREYKKSELRDLLNHFHGRIEEGSLAISPCWFGVMQLNWGIDVLPAWLENLCHFWFVVFVKC
ncbi:MAG TPA: class I SAM-dependent methyltransferase [Candidatus Binatia bacterium]|nr:MAG: hypothetical protein A2V88_07065 [Elusimicrobia bacterium RBG_16_66_12]HJX10705.1 class I SAM-dependent methyltransferase [Candidatus Binatia bacterium]